MHPPAADTVLLRHGELGIKSDSVRRAMEERLRDNLAAALAWREVPGEVTCERTRLYVHTDTAHVEAATAAAADTFGVVSASPTTVVEPTRAAITTALADAAEAVYAADDAPETFAVRARRAGDRDTHPFTSEDLEREGGGAVFDGAERAGAEPAVDLDDPARTFYVECRFERAFVFLEKRSGPGGLPLGSQQPLVALVSGGIDSPVAAWLAMRRGTPIYPLYVDLGDYGGVDHRLRAERTVADLARYVPDGQLSLRVAPGGVAVERLVRTMTRARMLGLRRFMFRVAEHVAAAVDAVGIVSGEAIGQKSSQTSTNLAATSRVTDLPVHRPLLSMDKTDITERARAIGTFEDATIEAGCNRVAPGNPGTMMQPAAVAAAEPEDIVDLAEACAEELTARTIAASRAD
jgi:thiamine biosynthesis protein ThiI